MIVAPGSYRCGTRLLVIVMVVLLGAPACGGSGEDAAPAPSATGGGPPPNRPTGAVYAAVIRQLVLIDHGFGGAPSPYQAVYVLNGALGGAGDPDRLADRVPPRRFSSDLKHDVAGRLSDLPSVEFVDRRQTVIAGGQPGHVIHRGVFITLAPIRWVGEHEAWVANSRWASGLNGQWLTYRVILHGSRWTITGVVGGRVAIS